MTVLTNMYFMLAKEDLYSYLLLSDEYIWK
jgi:hypothetical protein